MIEWRDSIVSEDLAKWSCPKLTINCDNNRKIDPSKNHEAVKSTRFATTVNVPDVIDWFTEAALHTKWQYCSWLDEKAQLRGKY